MKSSFQQKTSGVLAVGLITIIVVAFAISGIQTGTNQIDSVGKVGKYEIAIKEYNRSFKVMHDRYSQIFGGRPLGQDEIKRFRLKEAAFEQVVSSKLMLTLADQLQLVPGTEQVKQTIQSLPNIKNEAGQFDVERYKNLLYANRLTAKEFEGLMVDDIKAKSAYDSLNGLTVSNLMATDLAKAKENTLIVNALKIPHQVIKKNMPVSKAQLSNYLSDPENLKKVKSVFETKKSSLASKEKITASHILIRINDGNDQQALEKINSIKNGLTPNNFKEMAKKHTEEVSGKNTGGDLGTFARGKMVKDFEDVAFTQKVGTISEPVKTQFGYHLIYVKSKSPEKEASFDEHKRILAIELIRKEDNKNFKNYFDQVIADYKNALLKDNQKLIKDLDKKYLLNSTLNAEVNLLSHNVNGSDLKSSTLKKLYSYPQNVLVSSDQDKGETTLIKFVKLKSFDRPKESTSQSKSKEIVSNPRPNTESEKSGLESALTSYFNQKILQQLRSEVTVTSKVETI